VIAMLWRIPSPPGRAARVASRAGILGAALAVVAALLGVPATPAAAADATPYRATWFEHGYDTGKYVTLSFDAHENADYVPTVLQVLRDNQITAAFGLTGQFVTNYPSAARSIVAAGHKILNHSYDHPHFPALTQAQRWSQLDRTEAAFQQYLGVGSGGWFRTPYRDGYTDPTINRDLALRGFYINFDWTFDTTGYAGASWTTIQSRIHQYMRPGAIIVMHASSPSTDPQFLPQIIAELRAMGYSFRDPYTALTWGAIRAKWLALGGRTSAFGAARTPEMVATTTGTAVQWFQKGRIYWRSGTPTVYVFGAILSKYQSIGTVTSSLGFPVTDELAAAGGGRYNNFQNAYSAIYWSSATAAHVVLGAIRTKWNAYGGSGGSLGYPVADEAAVTIGRASQVQHGNVYWSSGVGAHAVTGAILTRYLSLGGTGGRLGVPVTDPYAVSGGLRVDFAHGSIIWNSATGATTVIYR
jgi:peptidoglycan/xylan/chitin deacetylase (PgdA/CDA1 family)